MTLLEPYSSTVIPAPQPHVHRWVPESPMCFQWTTEGPKMIARCSGCPARGPYLPPDFKVGVSDLRWNTDNEGDPSVSPLVGRKR